MTIKPLARYPIAVGATCPTATLTEVSARKHQMTIDEPPHNGGQDAGPLPLEVLFAAFAGCTNVIANKIAAEMGITLRDLEIEVSGDLMMAVIRGEGGNPFPTITLSVTGSSDAAPAQIEQLREGLAHRCPVSAPAARGRLCDRRALGDSFRLDQDDGKSNRLAV